MASFNASMIFNINYFLTFSLSVGFNATLLYLIKSNTSTKFKRFTTLKPIHIFGIYCIGFACVAVLATMHVLPYDDINLMPDALEIITTMAYWQEHRVELSTFCAARLLNLYIVFSIIGMLLIINSCGILLMYFNNRVNSYLKNSQVHMISKTIQAQQQISRQLMFQFCLPGIVGTVSIVCATCLILLPEYSGGIVMLLFVPFHWIPVLNPLITILCINDYRRQVFRLWKPATVRSGSTVVVPTATGNVESKVYYTGTVSLAH
uniref:G-protein coupled receptors family 1 profile domain-containing protein n=1 Tax=Panagrellus redivivus TaxID=6233 RepID=A0A7E4VRL4_PANRE